MIRPSAHGSAAVAQHNALHEAIFQAVAGTQGSLIPLSGLRAQTDDKAIVDAITARSQSANAPGHDQYREQARLISFLALTQRDGSVSVADESALLQDIHARKSTAAGNREGIELANTASVAGVARELPDAAAWLSSITQEPHSLHRRHLSPAHHLLAYHLSDHEAITAYARPETLHCLRALSRGQHADDGEIPAAIDQIPAALRTHGLTSLPFAKGCLRDGAQHLSDHDLKTIIETHHANLDWDSAAPPIMAMLPERAQHGTRFTPTTATLLLAGAEKAPWRQAYATALRSVLSDQHAHAVVAEGDPRSVTAAALVMAASLTHDRSMTPAEELESILSLISTNVDRGGLLGALALKQAGLVRGLSGEQLGATGATPNQAVVTLTKHSFYREQEDANVVAILTNVTANHSPADPTECALNLLHLVGTQRTHIQIPDAVKAMIQKGRLQDVAPQRIKRHLEHPRTLRGALLAMPDLVTDAVFAFHLRPDRTQRSDDQTLVAPLLAAALVKRLRFPKSHERLISDPRDLPGSRLAQRWVSRQSSEFRHEMADGCVTACAQWGPSASLVALLAACGDAQPNA